MIVYEQNVYESEERYYFRSSNGRTPICELARKGDGWEVLFYRGAAHPGPHPYKDFEHAKAHIMRYLRPREAELAGDPAPWTTAGNCDHLTALPREEVKRPRQTRRRYR